MARFFRKQSDLLRQRPGEKVYIGPSRVKETDIHEILFDTEILREESGAQLIGKERNTISDLHRWININGLGDMSLIQNLEEIFGLHQLTAADIVNTTMRPKLEEIENGYFLILKMLRFDEEKEMIISEQLSLLKIDDTVLTFQEQPGDVFDPVRKRLAESIGRIRREDASFLAYSLIDCVVDNYIEIMQILAEKIESLEEDLLSDPDEETLEMILSRKRELMYLGKVIRPARDAIKNFLKEGNPLVAQAYRPYFNDLLSNIMQVTETIDIYKEICTEQLNSYNSTINNRLNEIMKFLTIFSVIFLPLTLITGIYGTNFAYIPELTLRYGYLFLWALLLVSAGVMIFIFKRKKWF